MGHVLSHDAALAVPVTVFADSIALLLVFAHAAAAMVLAGSAGHLGWLALARLRGRDVPAPRLLRHARVVGACILVSFLFGLLAYPHYRYHVRGLVLDRDFPWASNLFDLKEHAAALTVPLCVGLLGVERSAAAPRASAALALGLSALVLFVIAAGLVVTSVKGG